MEEVDQVLLSGGGSRLQCLVLFPSVGLCGNLMLSYSPGVAATLLHAPAKSIAMASNKSAVWACAQQVETELLILHLAATPSLAQCLVARRVQHGEPATIPTLRPGPTISEEGNPIEPKLRRARLHLGQNPRLSGTEIQYKPVVEDSSA